MRSRFLPFLAALTLALAPAPSFAQSEGPVLTPAQQERLDAVKEDMLRANGDPSVKPSAAQQVNEWVEIGQGIGSGLGAAARELGVVANEFAQTPVGMLTIGIIVWKVMGGDIVQLLVGTAWFIGATSIWFYFYRKLYVPAKISYEYHENGKLKLKTIIPDTSKDGDRDVVRIAGAVGIGICWLAGIWIIFA